MIAAGSSGLTSWEAAGVRHAVLLRVLPVLSHDLATPITVLRMTAMVLRRKLALDPIDVDYFGERLAALEQQTEVLGRTLKLLGGWGPGGAGDAADVSRSGLVTGCVALLQPLLRMRGIRIETDPALEVVEDEVDAQARSLVQGAQSRWPGASSLRYLLLASICYLQDVQPHLERIEIRPDGDDALRLIPVSQRPPADARARAPVAGDDAVLLDASALECLAGDLGRTVRFNRDELWLQLSAA